MNYLSVCSGVEAASQAWEPLGWTPVAFSEIEPFPCAVLASRFPNVLNLGDMSKIHYNRETKELTNGTVRIVCDGGIDLLVGGTPCQSFSVAGKRAGLEGASGLAYHYARLIGEIQPRWFVWENVPGALSSVTYGDQRDFNFLLQQFAIGGDADLGVRWDLCWRVLDTQYVRVERFPLAIPQRRRRVFVVGHLAGDGGSGCEVLLEREGVRGNPAPRRVKGQGFARDIGAGVAGADGEGCLGRGIEAQSFDFLASQSIDHCDKAYERAETCRRQDGCGVGVALSYPAASNTLTARYGGSPQPEIGNDADVKVAVSFLPTNSANARSLGEAEEVAPTMARGCGESGNKPSVAIRTAQGVEAIGIGRDALDRGENAAPFGMTINEDVAPTKSSRGPGGVCTSNALIETYENHAADARVRHIDCAATIGSERNTGLDNNNPLCAYRYAVRRITPIEGERLQGFADNWTRPCFATADITDALCDRFVAIHREWAAINGKPNAAPKSRDAIRKWLTAISSADCPDGPRYKAIGNSMSVNVMEWIGERIDDADADAKARANI